MSAKAAEGKKKEPKPAAANGSKDKAPRAPKAAEAKPEEAGAAPSKGAAPTNNKSGNQANRIPKPEVAERDAQVEAINAEINKLKAERDETVKKIAEAIDSSKGGNEERQKIRQEADKIRDELKAARDEKDAVLAQQKAAVALLEAKQAEERKAKEGLGKFTTTEAIDAEISRIEKTMTSSNFSAKEEKDMIREMDKLRLSKKNIGALKAKTEEVQKARDAKKDIDARFNEKRAIADEINKRYTNLRDALTAMSNKDKEGVGAAIPKLREKKDALNTQIDALLVKKAGVYDEFKKKMTEFHALLEEKRRQDKERREAEEERRRQEREEREKQEAERLKAIEEEELKKKPWEAEIALCDVLIAYLERLSKTSQGSSSSGSASATGASSSSNSASKRVGTDFGDLKPLLRNQDDDYIKLGKSKAKAPAAAKPASKDKPSALTHTLDILNSFALISLIPPTNEAGIEASIAQIKEKRAYYDVLPRPAKVKAAPATEAQNGEPKVAAAETTEKPSAADSRKGTASKRSAPPGIPDVAAFPQLPGSKPTSDVPESKQKWGPKPAEATSADEVAEEAADEVAEVEME